MSPSEICPHVRILWRSSEEFGALEDIQQGIARDRVQSPQALHLWFGQMEPRNLEVLGLNESKPMAEVGVLGNHSLSLPVRGRPWSAHSELSNWHAQEAVASADANPQQIVRHVAGRLAKRVPLGKFSAHSGKNPVRDDAAAGDFIA